MRDFSADHRWLSLNTATVRKQGDLVEIVEACARHGIRAIDPWRDQVAPVGLDRAARAVRDAGLELSGYCRGGMFTLRRRTAQRSARRQSPLRRRGQGAGRALHRARRRRTAAIFTARQRGVQGHRGGARAGCMTASPRCWNTQQQAKIPLAIEPLHPAYAADRACVNMTETGARYLRCARSRPQRRARRRAERLPHLVGSEADGAIRFSSCCGSTYSYVLLPIFFIVVMGSNTMSAVCITPSPIPLLNALMQSSAAQQKLANLLACTAAPFTLYSRPISANSNIVSPRFLTTEICL